MNGSALLLCLCLPFDGVKNVLQDLGGCLISGLYRVRINLAGGGCVRVSQARRNGGEVRTGGNQQGCVRVPLRYNYDKPEKPRISRAFGYLARFFILFQTEKSSREVVIS